MRRTSSLASRSTCPALRLASLPVAALLLLAVLLGCLRGPGTQPGTLTYEGPQTYTLKPGDWLPGTDIRYMRKTDSGAEFVIAGQRALKKTADSLNWSGSPAGGVKLDLRTRIIWIGDEEVRVLGTVKVAVSDVAPQPGEANTKAPLSYETPVAYGLKVGAKVPGTLVTYEGKGPEGARFSGVEGYPYRQIGDSLVWEGRLRANVALRVVLRVVQFSEESTRLAGVAHLWISP